MAAQRVIAIRPDPSLLEAVGSVLDPSVCALETCAGSVDALRRVREYPADVLVTDPASPIDEDLALVAELVNVRPALRSAGTKCCSSSTSTEGLRSSVLLFLDL